MPIWELDQEQNIRDKQARFEKKLGKLPENLHLVSIDFDRQDAGGALVGASYDPRDCTFFIWEGVTQYVTQAGIEATLRFLSGAPAGSRLAFTYVVRDFIEGREVYGCRSAYDKYVKGQKLWIWGRNPQEWPELLNRFGWAAGGQHGGRSGG